MVLRFIIKIDRNSSVVLPAGVVQCLLPAIAELVAVVTYVSGSGCAWSEQLTVSEQ